MQAWTTRAQRQSLVEQASLSVAALEAMTAANVPLDPALLGALEQVAGRLEKVLVEQRMKVAVLTQEGGHSNRGPGWEDDEQLPHAQPAGTH